MAMRRDPLVFYLSPWSLMEAEATTHTDQALWSVILVIIYRYWAGGVFRGLQPKPIFAPKEGELYLGQSQNNSSLPAIAGLLNEER